MKILIRVTNDGYLIAATEDLVNGLRDNYWPDYYEKAMVEFEPITKEVNVPEDVAQKLLVHGTSEQYYSDGYEAMKAVNENNSFKLSSTEINEQIESEKKNNFVND